MHSTQRRSASAVFAASALCFGGAALAQSSATLLVHYDVDDPASWDGTVLRDILGFGQDMTPSAGVGYVASGAGPADRAYLDFADFGHLGESGVLGSAFNPIGDGGYTMEGYFYIASSGFSAEENSGIGFSQNVASENQFIRVPKGGGSLLSQTQVDNLLGPGEDYETVDQDVTGLIPRDRWFHVVKVFDAAAHEVRWYIDGVPQPGAAATLDADGSALEFHPRDEAYGNVGEAGRAIKGIGYSMTRFYRGVLSDAEILVKGRGTVVSIRAGASASEEGPVHGEFLVERRGILDDPVTVCIDVRRDPGDAEPAADYTTVPDVLASGEIVFAAGVGEATVTVIPVDDAALEGVETVFFSIADGPYKVDASNGAAQISLFDDEAPAGAFTLTSPADRLRNVPLTPTLEWEDSSNAPVYTVTVDDDEDLSSPVLQEQVGQTSYAVGAGVLQEGTLYWWTVRAHSPALPPPEGVDATGGPFQFRTVYPTPVVTIEATDPVAYENPSSGGIFTITRSLGDPTLDLTVRFDIAGDAVNGTDYVALQTRKTMMAGTGTVTVTVIPRDNTDVGTKTVVITLTETADYVLGPSGTETATVTICDDDSPPEPFDLLFPVDGELRVPLARPSTTLDLEWEAALGATSYVLELGLTESLTDPVAGATVASPGSSVTLVYETTYYWRVTALNRSGATPATGTEAAPWSFRTEDDHFPPSVLWTGPGDGDDRVEADVRIRVRFSEPMDRDATNAAFSLVAGDRAFDGSFDWSEDGCTMSFTPAGGLEWDTSHTVTIAASAVDAAADANALDGDGDGSDGESPDDDYVFTFITAEELFGLAAARGCCQGTGACFAAVLTAAVAWTAARRRP